MGRALAAFFALILAACGGGTEHADPNLAAIIGADTPAFHGDDNPEWLSAWGVFAPGDALRLNDGVVPYTLNSALFSDYALKLRTIWIAGGGMADVAEDGRLDFPVGTVISKTFYYARGGGADVRVAAEPAVYRDRGIADRAAYRLIETRLLVRRVDGWHALAYVWDEAAGDARLTRIGDIQRLKLDHGGTVYDVAYQVPNINQCGGCHLWRGKGEGIQPIGPQLKHLNRDGVYAGGLANQLDVLKDAGLLPAGDYATATHHANWQDAGASLAARAAAYLDINCAHCHNPAGPADTSGLYLDSATTDPTARGLCKLPIAAGRGTGGRHYSVVPGDPEASILLYRMASSAPDIRMPELGRVLVHDAGVALVRDWISGLSGGCS